MNSECKCFVDLSVGLGGANYDYTQNLWREGGPCNHARAYNQQTKKRTCWAPFVGDYDCSYTYWLYYYYINSNYGCQTRL